MLHLSTKFLFEPTLYMSHSCRFCRDSKPQTFWVIISMFAVMWRRGSRDHSTRSIWLLGLSIETIPLSGTLIEILSLKDIGSPDLGLLGSHDCWTCNIWLTIATWSWSIIMITAKTYTIGLRHFCVTYFQFSVTSKSPLYDICLVGPWMSWTTWTYPGTPEVTFGQRWVVGTLHVLRLQPTWLVLSDRGRAKNVTFWWSLSASYRFRVIDPRSWTKLLKLSPQFCFG